jgi:uncharacterized repeat protein (TIGR03803 family)
MGSVLAVDAKERSVMRRGKFSAGLIAAVVVVLAVFGTARRAAAQQEQVVYAFGADYNRGGSLIPAGVISDSAGNLYGAAYYANTSQCEDGCGTIFELMPQPGGGWTEKVLHNFGKDGHYPYCNLVFDAAGNLYGTTSAGGSYDAGMVFELTPTASGEWTETVLHNFDPANGSDGAGPQAGVILDPSGNLYGTTYGGGTSGEGTVFEVIRQTDGSWANKTLHSFNSSRKDGAFPIAALTLDGSGVLYGTTWKDGAYTDGGGIVFELTPNANGKWSERILRNFGGNYEDGNTLYSSVILDNAGNLYGTALIGGAYGEGVAFELTPTSNGSWTEKVLYAFGATSGDGQLPQGTLTFDAAGNLYGTTAQGGYHNYGTVYELTPSAAGNWTETVLHAFTGPPTDGEYPQANLIFGTGGYLYSTTESGGASYGGTVFAVKP